MSETMLDIGDVQWHSSEADGGPDVGMLLQIDADNAIWFGEISQRAYERGGADAAALGGDGGWWIVHYNKQRGASLIGKCVETYPLAADFVDMLAAAIRRP